MEPIGNALNSPRLILISAHHSLNAAQNLEDLKEKEKYYVEARRLAEQAAKINSTDATKFKAKQDLAAIWFDYGRFLDMQRRFTEAEDAYRKARDSYVLQGGFKGTIHLCYFPIL